MGIWLKNKFFFLLVVLIPLIGQCQDMDLLNVSSTISPIKIIVSSHSIPLLSKQSGWKYVYVFNDSGRVITQNIFKGTQLKESFVFNYDKMNQLVRQEYKETNKEGLHTFWNYEYDSMGRISRKAKFVDSDKSDPEMVEDGYKYNRANNVVSSSTVTYSKNKRGKVFRSTCYNTYDNTGRIIEKNILDDSGTSTYTYSYNSHGVVCEVNFKTKFAVLPNTESKLEYDYDFDKNGNWIRRFIIIKGKKYLEFTREILSRE